MEIKLVLKTNLKPFAGIKKYQDNLRAVFENDGILPTRLPSPTSEASLNNSNRKKVSR